MVETTDGTTAAASIGSLSLHLDWRDLAKRTVRSSAFWGVVLAVATWANNGAALEPLPGLDNSWQASLYMQAHMGMAAGSHGVFTYGPLGFLIVTRLYYPALTLLALMYHGAMAAAIYGLLVLGIRSVASLPVSVLVAALAGAPMVVNYGGPEGWLAVGCICAVYIIRQPADRPASAWWWGALGVMAGVNLLTKTTVGVCLVLACLVVVTCAPRGETYRRIYALLGSGIAIFLVGWLGTGNGVSNFASFANGAVAVASGYSSAMSVPPNRIAGFSAPYTWPLLGLAPMVLAAVVVLVTGFIAELQATRSPATGPATHVGRSMQLPPQWKPDRSALIAYWRRTRVGVGVILVLGLALFFLYKEAVVRQGPRAYFASLPILFVGALIGRPQRVRAFGRAGLIAVVLITALMGYLYNSGSTASSTYNNARSSFDIPQPAGVERFVDQVTTVLADPGPKIREYRAVLQTLYALPPKVLDQIGSRTVAFDPWENTFAWAYPQLHWDPLPVMQDYSAYTPYLDKLDANFLRSSRAPVYILRQPVAISGRSPTLDPPQTELELACRYRDVGEFNGFQLLKSTADRCGKPTAVATVSTGYGQTITVPSAPPGDMIAATFGLQKSLGWDLLNLLYQPPGFNLRVNDSPQVVSFVSGTAGDMHMIRTPASLGWGIGFAPTPIRTMIMSEANQASTTSGVVVHFYAIPMS